MKSTTGLIPQKAAISFFRCLFLAIIMISCFLSSCTKKEDLVLPASKDAATLVSKSLKCDRVFLVSPSGNFNDDSYNIQNALDQAVAAGPGCTVQLTKGTFYLNKGLVVEGFYGFFKGAGKEKTMITTHGKVEFILAANGDFPALIKFRLGDVHISDLTISISDPEPCIVDWLSNSLPCVIMITGNSSDDPVSTDQTANSTFDNVKFVGGTGGFTGDGLGYFNVYAFVMKMPTDNQPAFLKGDIRITKCEFQTAFFSLWTQNTNGPITIGGAGSSGNKFEDTDFAYFLMDMTTSKVNISYNHFAKIYYSALIIQQGYFVDPATLSLSKFIVYGNDIEVRPYDPATQYDIVAIWVIDGGIWTGIDKKIDANISNNKIYLNNINRGAIWGSFTKDLIITNNKIWGSGMAGIYCGINDETSSDWLIKGNDVERLNVSVAPIWLGPASSNCVVYADKKDVLDEGANNILIGDHNKRTGHPGPYIKDAVNRQREMMKLIKRPGMR